MTYAPSIDTVEHLVALVLQAEPRWDPSLTRIVLINHSGQVDGTDLAIAALRAARSGKYPTPKSIFWHGPHWDGLDSTPPEHRESRARCSVCGRTEQRCYQVRHGDDDHRFDPTVARR